MALITPPLALYLHFPWCVRKCPYCDFNSHTLHGELPQEAYLDALLADLDAQLPRVAGRTVVSVFLGGGTPSLLPADLTTRVLQFIRANFDVAPAAEVTLEANPASTDERKLAAWLDGGVNRLSLGVQGFDGHALAVLERRTDAAQARASRFKRRARRSERERLPRAC